MPPPDLMFEAFNHTSLEAYDRTGSEHAAVVASLVRRYVDADQLHGLEWGCGPGRVIRHLHEMVPNLAALTGADFNRRSIHWCQEHLVGSEFYATDLRPPLPFEDASFDFVYALSVLTHLNEDGWTSWLPELARVTRPSGLIVFTTHGEAFLPKLLPQERRLFESGRAVVRHHSREGKKLFATYHPVAFVRRTLPSTLSILRHEASGGPWPLQQDVWVVRKTSTAH